MKLKGYLESTLLIIALIIALVGFAGYKITLAACCADAGTQAFGTGSKITTYIYSYVDCGDNVKCNSACKVQFAPSEAAVFPYVKQNVSSGSYTTVYGGTSVSGTFFKRYVQSCNGSCSVEFQYTGSYPKNVSTGTSTCS